MIIVYDQIDNEKNTKRICLVFGAGLIGRKIVDYLQSGGMICSEYYPFSWMHPAYRNYQFTTIDARIEELLLSIQQSIPERVYLTVLWSAGHGGFFSSEQNLAREVISFKQVQDFADRLFSKYTSTLPSFHMLSSAGGLFEGQRNVGSMTPPNPLRPYGWCKLEQENIIDSWNTHAVKHCYRPSSVYGLPLFGQRLGLIPTLIQSGLQRRVVNFSGHMDTIRDYVSVEDIGRYISAHILHSPAPGGTFTLASAEPATLYQLKSAVENCIQHKIYAHFELEPQNTADNSFLASILPSNWMPTPVTTGLRKYIVNYCKAGCIAIGCLNP